jgi:hypothetical protein
MTRCGGAADVVFDSAGEAGALLREAWAALYGRDPNPEHAYDVAVRAVEKASIPIVQPSHASATLGTVIGELRNNPQLIVVALQPDRGDAGDTVRAMLELLWTSQQHRHAGNAPVAACAPLEAEGAVHLATTLVHYFTAGVERRARTRSASHAGTRASSSATSCSATAGSSHRRARRSR